MGLGLKLGFPPMRCSVRAACITASRVFSVGSGPDSKDLSGRIVQWCQFMVAKHPDYEPQSSVRRKCGDLDSEQHGHHAIGNNDWSHSSVTVVNTFQTEGVYALSSAAKFAQVGRASR